MQSGTLIQNSNPMFAWGTVDTKGGARNKGSKNWNSKMVKVPCRREVLGTCPRRSNSL